MATSEALVKKNKKKNKKNKKKKPRIVRIISSDLMVGGLCAGGACQHPATHRLQGAAVLARGWVVRRHRDRLQRTRWAVLVRGSMSLWVWVRAYMCVCGGTHVTDDSRTCLDW